MNSVVRHQTLTLLLACTMAKLKSEPEEGDQVRLVRSLREPKNLAARVVVFGDGSTVKLQKFSKIVASKSSEMTKMRIMRKPSIKFISGQCYPLD